MKEYFKEEWWMFPFLWHTAAEQHFTCEALQIEVKTVYLWIFYHSKWANLRTDFLWAEDSQVKYVLSASVKIKLSKKQKTTVKKNKLNLIKFKYSSVFCCWVVAKVLVSFCSHIHTHTCWIMLPRTSLKKEKSWGHLCSLFHPQRNNQPTLVPATHTEDAVTEDQFNNAKWIYLQFIPFITFN